MLPPRKWLWSLGLLAAAPVMATAGPLDVFKPKSETAATAARDNQQVAEDIAGALRAARLVGRDIDIEFKNGVAVLTGQIADEAQRAAADRIVGSVPGVKSVENRMTVMGNAPRSFTESPIQRAGFEGHRGGPVQQVQYEATGPQAGDSYAYASEELFQGAPAAGGGFDNQQTAQQIAEAVQAAGLQNYDLEIRYVDGTCTLLGGVDAKAQAVAAAEAASRVPGVKTVLNQMTVNGRPVSVVPHGDAKEPVAMYQPYRSAQEAQLAYQRQMQAQQMAQAGPQGGVQTVGGQMPPQYGGPGGPNVPPGYGPMGGQMTGPQMSPGGPGSVPPGYPLTGAHQMYNRPNVPDHAWPAYAPYDNYAAVSYPSQYEASAWPYIGPFYPYPQVPAEWRSAQLVWEDGYWNLKFDSKTDKWWWFMNPNNWH
ncbi:MAG: BON domain-containing protein [Planctomycetaceae bacterium]